MKPDIPSTPLAVVILAAGRGTRMRSAIPKVMHTLAGRPLLNWVIAAAEDLSPDKIIVVTAPDMQDVVKAAKPHLVVFQDQQLGTGDAVKAALEALQGFQGDVIVLLGDTPLIRAESLQALRAARHGDENIALSVLGMRPDNPAGYGRLIVDQNGWIEQIVEDKDCAPEQKHISLCNAGAFCFNGAQLPTWISKLKNANAQGEYYLTDVPAIAREARDYCAVYTASESEVAGVNTRIHLAALEANVQNTLRQKAMEQGVSMQAPETVFLSFDTALGQDVVLEPNIWFGPGVTVEDNVTIRAFSHLEGVHVQPGAVIGPYARLRPGSKIGHSAKIGNFVEVKKAVIEDEAKISHLSYIGDAKIGARSNVGAGTITCNYDGFDKFVTEIGADCFIGSNTVLVSPVHLGDGAFTAAGSIITKDVDKDALAIARSRQELKPGWAKKFRAIKQAKKAP